MVYKFKISFSEKKLPLIENLRITTLNYFKHRINIILVIFVLRKFLTLVISLKNKWSIENAAVFPFKTSAFSKKCV